METLTEICDCRGACLRVDREAGVLRGVKVLGLASRNGRAYLDEALARACALYEGAKVNVNHAGAGSAPRDYRDRIGILRNAHARAGEGLFADLYFNPKHPLAEQLAWDAEHAPENVGLSHDVEARTAQRDGRTVVESIVRVRSVDLVADPATTRGLFEAAGPAAADAELARLREQVGQLETQLAAAARRDLARRLLAEFDLPASDADRRQSGVLVGQRFFEALLDAPDERAMRALVEERAQLVRALGEEHARPRSRDQAWFQLAAPRDAKAFVEAIT